MPRTDSRGLVQVNQLWLFHLLISLTTVLTTFGARGRGLDLFVLNLASFVLFSSSGLAVPSDFDGGLQDFGKQAHQLLSAVTALDERFGTRMPILLLRGSVSDGAAPCVCSEGQGCDSAPLNKFISIHF